jgi:hypothetical protein
MRYIVVKNTSTGKWYLKPNLNWSDSISDAKRWKCFYTAETFAKSEQNAEVLQIA